MEEEQEKRAAEELGKEKETSVEEASMEKVSMEKGFQTEGDLLTADSTSCTYPADQPLYHLVYRGGYFLPESGTDRRL